MRILHLIHVRFWNAAAQYAVDLAAAQHEAGHDVRILTAAGQPPAAHANRLGLTVVERPLRGLGALAAVPEIRRLAAGVDVVNAHHADLQNLALMALPRHNGPRMVRTRVDVRPAKGGALTRYLYNRRLDAIIVPGEESRQRYIGDLGIEPHNVHTVYGGVDHRLFRPDAERRRQVREAMGVPKHAVVFLFLGRLDPVKAPEIFIEAAARVGAERKEAHFWLAGRPTPSATAETHAAMARQAGVRLVGVVDDVPALLAAADVGVITSVASEAHCRVGLEMMACALPVIGTDIGVIPEVVKHGETGYIVRSRSVTELASAMQRLCAEDPRLPWGRNARERVETGFTFERWVERTAAVYGGPLRVGA